MSNNECKLLFALRSNSVRGLKANTPSIFKNNLSCSLKYNLSKNIDDQQHHLTCTKIQDALSLPEIEDFRKIEYCDIYRSIEKQKSAVLIITRLLEVREGLLERSSCTTTPTSGATLDTAPKACQGSDGD